MTIYSDQNPAPPRHDELGCIEWCNHCALCGTPVLYGARCREHYGVYPKSVNEYFELWKVANTDTMRLTFLDQTIEFDIEKLDDLKEEIRGWELRYYE